MWLVLLCFIFLSTGRGFSLEPDHTANQTGKNEWLPLGTHLSDKDDLQHQMNKLQRENEQKIDKLTSKLQSRLSAAFEEKFSENDRKNETLKMEILEKKYQELGIKHTFLQDENQLLRYKYTYFQCEINRVQNTTAETSKNVSELQQLKITNQVLDFRAIQKQVQSLEHKSNLLTNNPNAWNQDLLALYNVPSSYPEDEKEATLNDEFLKIKLVAVTACVASDQMFSDYIVKFSTVYFQVGINNIDMFKSSGKFVCEIPGLYFISAQIRTSDQNFGFNVKKNGKNIAYSRSNLGDIFSLNPISAVVELQHKDTLYVFAFKVNIYGLDSCLSIMKVK